MALLATPIIILMAFLPLASCLTSDWSTRLIGIGLAFEIAGAWYILVRPFMLEHQLYFGAVGGSESDRMTEWLLTVGPTSLVLGFIIQFVAVVFV